MLLLLGAALITPPAGAQPPPEHPSNTSVSQGLTFYADLSATLTPAGAIVADVLVEIPWTSLRFSREGNGWVARFDLTLLVYDRSGNQVNGDLWTIPIRSSDPDHDQSAGKLYRRRIPMTIGSGRLRFELKVAQTGSGRGGEWIRVVDVPRFDSFEIGFSKPEVGRCDVPAPDEDPWIDADSTWTWESFRPVVRRRYGDQCPDLCLRGELYDHVPDPGGDYHLRWSVIGRNDRPVVGDTLTVARNDNRGRWFLHVPLNTLTHGTWRLRLESSLGQKKAVREEEFEIDETRLDPEEDSEMIRGVLAYIAGNDELVALEDLPADSLRSFWDEFWLRRDPSPGTPQNENRDEFMRRVDYANANFSAIDPGWRSDMGRIYIRYGPPDQIERVPYSTNGPPHEIWVYTARDLRFVFVDADGFGRYRLNGRERP